jgi:hypothetical protein
MVGAAAETAWCMTCQGTHCIGCCLFVLLLCLLCKVDMLLHLTSKQWNVPLIRYSGS